MNRPAARERFAAPVQALLAALLFGASTPLAAPLARSASPILIAGVLYVGSALGLSLWLLAARRPLALRSLARGERPALAGAIVFGGMLGPALLMLGLRHTPAASTALLLNLEIVFSAVLAWVFFRENAGARVVTGLLMIFAGAIVLVLGSARGVPDLAWGAAAVAGACLCWGIDNNLTRNVVSVPPVAVAWVKGVVAGPANVGIALLAGAGLPAPGGVALALLVGALGYGASLVLFIGALRRLGTARTTAYFATAPFAGALLAFVLDQRLPDRSFIGAAALVAFGVWLHLSERHSHAHSHPPLTHAHEHVHDEHHRHEHSAAEAAAKPHAHEHAHEPLEHTHPHTPDIHHLHH